MRKIKNKPEIYLLPLAVFIALGGYLIVSGMAYGLGYPLDDAWIHLTYARNLVKFGQWMFLPGVVSGGSTSPLWTLLLTPAFLFNLSPIIWTTLLGFIGLIGLGYLCCIFLNQYLESKSVGWIAIVIVFEWHFVWAALSGMETLLQTIGNLAVAVLLFSISRKKVNLKSWLWLGLLIGGLVWVRPDSITWLGPAGVLLFFGIRRKEQQNKFSWLFLTVGFLIPFLAYLLFNYLIAGSIWPNTMYAKQAEYQAQLSVPFLNRYFSLFLLTFVGSAIVLIPGILYNAFWAIKQKSVVLLTLYLWWMGMIGIYAAKLPVTYQHGRYMMPTMIFPILFGIMGTVQFSQSIKLNLIAKRRLNFTGQALFIGLLIAFYGLGATAYRDDVGVIETEMVQTARWVSENIPQGDVLAVHDIGAMGYYSQRDFLDLAGLINPEVIPFIRDEAQLGHFLDEKNVDYVIVFPTWYPTLVEQKEVLYRTGNKLSPSLGGENMTIYCWEKYQ